MRCEPYRTGRQRALLSALYGPKGENLAGTPDSEEKIQTIELSLEALTTFRHKFPSWKDADPFLLY